MSFDKATKKESHSSRRRITQEVVVLEGHKNTPLDERSNATDKIFTIPNLQTAVFDKT